MKKKVLAAVLSLSMILSTGVVAMADETKDPSEVKVGVITDVGGVNDGSFNQSAWEGLTRANEELGITTNYLESHTDSDYIPNLETFIDEEYDLIICIGYQLADAMREEAEANPDQKFAIVDDATCADLDNVTCLMFEQAQASYLVGYVAGLTTKSNTIGFTVFIYWLMTDSRLLARSRTSLWRRRIRRISESVSTKTRTSIISQSSLFSKIRIPSTMITLLGATVIVSLLLLWTL